MINKTMVVLVCIGYFINLNAPSTNELKQILSKPPKGVQYASRNIGKFDFKYPSNLISGFQSIIIDEMNNDQSLDVCEDAEVVVNYNVEFFNGDLLSFRKTTSIFNCYAIAVDYQEYFNYVLHDGKIISIKYNGSNLNDYKLSRIPLSQECIEGQNNIDTNLFFCDGKVFIEEFKDKSCQREIELIVNVNYMKFTED